jgi:hypothetical protein
MLNIYDVNARMRPIERVNAATSWEARKAYAERHGVHVTDVLARRVNVPANWPGTPQGQLLPGDD